jgi:hypothetical protein
MWNPYLRDKETGKLYKWVGFQFETQQQALEYIIKVAFSKEEFNRLFKDKKFLALFE